MASSSKHRTSSTTASVPLREAVVIMCTGDSGKPPTPSATRKMAISAIKAATDRSGITPMDTNVMDQLHSFSVRAPQAYIDALAEVPQVQQVLANEIDESPLIEPVRKRPVRLGD